MIKTYYIEVFGTTYMVEVETTVNAEKLPQLQKSSKQKASKNVIKTSPLFKDRREWFIK